jgi:hypothetical protein
MPLCGAMPGLERLFCTSADGSLARVILDPVCSVDLRYEGDFHLVRPYGNESGTGWGRGDGTVTGQGVSGSYAWSNHPHRRGDGSMLPNVRGVVTTIDGAEVMLEFTGRTSFDENGVGHQSLFVLFEAEHPSYTWLNDLICVGEGRIGQNLTSHIDVFACQLEK